MLRKNISLELAKLEQTDDEPRRFSGYLSVFNTEDFYGDVIAPGAFTKTLERRNGCTPLLWQHRPFQPIGKFVELREDDYGLRFQAELTPNHSVASDAWASIAHRSVDGMSIGFDISDGGALRNANQRVIHAVDLWEGSVVTFPAHSKARIGVLKAVQGITQLSEAEAVLRGHFGLSRGESKALIAKIRTVKPREAVDEWDPLAVKQALAQMLSDRQNLTATLVRDLKREAHHS